MHLNEFLIGDCHIRIIDGDNRVWTMSGSRQRADSACFLEGKPDKDLLSHSKLGFSGCVVVALLVLGLSLLDARGCTATSSANSSR